VEASYNPIISSNACNKMAAGWFRWYSGLLWAVLRMGWSCTAASTLRLQSLALGNLYLYLLYMHFGPSKWKHCPGKAYVN